MKTKEEQLIERVMKASGYSKPPEVAFYDYMIQEAAKAPTPKITYGKSIIIDNYDTEQITVTYDIFRDVTIRIVDTDISFSCKKLNTLITMLMRMKAELR